MNIWKETWMEGDKKNKNPTRNTNNGGRQYNNNNNNRVFLFSGAKCIKFYDDVCRGRNNTQKIDDSNTFKHSQQAIMIFSIRFTHNLPHSQSHCHLQKKGITRQVSLMIHSGRPTISLVENIVFTLFCFARFWSGDVRTDVMCENNDPYRPWLWVDRVDQ